MIPNTGCEANGESSCDTVNSRSCSFLNELNPFIKDFQRFALCEPTLPSRNWDDGDNDDDPGCSPSHVPSLCFHKVRMQVLTFNICKYNTQAH